MNTMRLFRTLKTLPIADLCARSFAKRERLEVDVTVPIGISGTAGGFRALCFRKADVAGAPRSITASVRGSRSSNCRSLTIASFLVSRRRAQTTKPAKTDTWLAKRIAEDPLSLGYFGLAYSQLEAHDSKTLAIDDGDFSNGVGAVLPTPATITSGEYGALSRLLFLYVNSKSLGRREVELFANFVLNKAERLVPQAGYVPLSHEGYEFALRQLAEKVTGSMFDKPEVYRMFERSSRQAGVAVHQ